MKRAITLAYADDHKMMRMALCEMLNKEPEFEILGSFDNGLEMVDFVSNQEVDILLLDIEMPVMDGYQAMKRIFELNPDQKIIIVSMHMDEVFIAQFMNNGARAFIPKSYSLEQIKSAILSVDEIGIYIDERISHVMVSNIVQTKKFKIHFDDNQLSKRELQIIKLICQEKTTREIGEELCIDTKTVEGHRSRIFKKLNAKSVIGVVVYAIEKGIYRPH
jgi:DNA-binding NarL/FixJ family response regulator